MFVFPLTRSVNSGRSAVCSFRLADIKSVFSGNYKVLNRDTLQWSTRVQEKVANPGEVSKGSLLIDMKIERHCNENKTAHLVLEREEKLCNQEDKQNSNKMISCSNYLRKYFSSFFISTITKKRSDDQVGNKPPG